MPCSDQLLFSTSPASRPSAHFTRGGGGGNDLGMRLIHHTVHLPSLSQVPPTSECDIEVVQVGRAWYLTTAERAKAVGDLQTVQLDEQCVKHCLFF